MRPSSLCYNIRDDAPEVRLEHNQTAFRIANRKKEIQSFKLQRFRHVASCYQRFQGDCGKYWCSRFAGWRKGIVNNTRCHTGALSSVNVAFVHWLIHIVENIAECRRHGVVREANRRTNRYAAKSLRPRRRDVKGHAGSHSTSVQVNSVFHLGFMYLT